MSPIQCTNTPTKNAPGLRGANHGAQSRSRDPLGGIVTLGSYHEESGWPGSSSYLFRYDHQSRTQHSWGGERRATHSSWCYAQPLFSPRSTHAYHLELSLREGKEVFLFPPQFYQQLRRADISLRGCKLTHTEVREQGFVERACL